MINLTQAKQAFASYVNAYDAKDEQIALKIRHTYEVMRYSEQIAKDLSLSKEQCDLAALIGLLHDIGRFEQVKRYHTFIDRDSIDHAKLGVDILSQDDFIRNFVEPGYDEIIKKAILNHNRYQIEDGLDSITNLHAKIIRDADKTDILRVNNENSCEALFMCSEEEMCQTTISKEVMDDFMSHQSILSNKRKTAGDVLLSHIALIYDFNFPTGLRIIQQQNWLDHMMHRFSFSNQEMIACIQQAQEEIHMYLKEKGSL